MIAAGSSTYGQVMASGRHGQFVNFIEAILVDHPGPLDGMYSPKYQNVQSSTGSTTMDV
jgi:hypothetical protein